MQEMRTSEIASRFIEGLDYPISKVAILEAARDASLGSTIQEALKKLPDREYFDPEDLAQQLNVA